LKNLVKKPACAIKSDIKSASRGGVSFPKPGKSPQMCVDATGGTELFTVPGFVRNKSSLCSLPSHGEGPPSHGEGVGKLGGRVRIDGIVPIATSSSSNSRYIYT